MLARVLPLLVIGLGIAIVIRTIALGVGGGVGLVVGALLILAGVLRLYLSNLRG